MASATFTVPSAADNAWTISGFSSYVTDPGYLMVGKINASGTETAWIRFTNVTIPKGSTINSAIVRLVSQGSSGTNARVITKCAAADNPAMPTTYAATTAVALTAGTDSGVINTSVVSIYQLDIATALQAVVNRAGFASGNSVLVAIQDNGSSSVHGLYTDSYSTGATNRPRLEVDWTPPASTTLAVLVHSHRQQGIM